MEGKRRGTDKGKAALAKELRILQAREKKILEKVERYEDADEDGMEVATGTEIRSDKGNTSIRNSDSAFTRLMKLYDVLNRVQGRIAATAKALRAIESEDARLRLEEKRLEVAVMRATGAVEVPDPEGGGA